MMPFNTNRSRSKSKSRSYTSEEEEDVKSKTKRRVDLIDSDHERNSKGKNKAKMYDSDDYSTEHDFRSKFKSKSYDDDIESISTISNDTDLIEPFSNIRSRSKSRDTDKEDNRSGRKPLRQVASIIAFSDHFRSKPRAPSPIPKVPQVNQPSQPSLKYIETMIKSGYKASSNTDSVILSKNACKENIIGIKRISYHSIAITPLISVPINMIWGALRSPIMEQFSGSEEESIYYWYNLYIYCNETDIIEYKNIEALETISQYLKSHTTSYMAIKVDIICVNP